MAREPRKLAVTLAADVVGYSRLMGHDGRASFCAVRSGANVNSSTSAFSGLVGEPCHDGIDVGVGQTFLVESRHFLLGPGTH